MIAVGETWEPEWTVDQPASTLWYHPHPHGQTAKHVYRGVSGLFLIEDDDAAAAGLPHEYGVDDIPLIIQDKRFTNDGDMTMDAGGFLEVFSGSQGFGVIGDTILVNVTWDPFLEVTRERIRFRLLNGSNARFYNVGFADDRPLISSLLRTGLCPAPRSSSPGSRSVRVSEPRSSSPSRPARRRSCAAIRSISAHRSTRLVPTTRGTCSPFARRRR
jgi:hypothetical protein